MKSSMPTVSIGWRSGPWKMPAAVTSPVMRPSVDAGRRDRLTDRGVVGDVDREAQRAATRRLDRRDRLLRVRLVPVEHRDRGAALGRELRGAAPDAAPASDDQLQRSSHPHAPTS